MTLHVDDETDTLVGELASARKLGRTDAARETLDQDGTDQDERLRQMRVIQARVASWGRTGLKADKAFYDSLNDE